MKLITGLSRTSTDFQGLSNQWNFFPIQGLSRIFKARGHPVDPVDWPLGGQINRFRLLFIFCLASKKQFGFLPSSQFQEFCENLLIILKLSFDFCRLVQFLLLANQDS